MRWKLSEILTRCLNRQNTGLLQVSSSVYSKAMRMLAFIRRQCHDFSHIQCLKILYCSLVHSHLEYGSILWNPSQLGLIHRLNKVQSCFLRFSFYKFKLSCSTMNLHQIWVFIHSRLDVISMVRHLS